MMFMTGAKAAMITLRDAKTCQIVNDVALETTFHSPLVCGFTMESAAYYLQQLRTIDPWAEAQRQHYPFQPTLMSTVCDPASMPDNKFFEWLSNLGCRETVVFELSRMVGYWSALNLFFEVPQGNSAISAKTYLSFHSDFLKEAWVTSQEFIHGKQSRQISLEQVGAPACIINQSYEILAHNSSFDLLKNKGTVAVFGPKKRLSVAHGIVFAGRPDISSGIGRHDSEATDCHAFMASFDPDPLHEGKRDGHQLIIFRSRADKRQANAIPVQLLESLTAQEKRMLEYVESGLSIRHAGDQVGVKRSRAFEIWGSVKSKLAISNAHQIRSG